MIRESIQQALKLNGIPQRRCAIDCGITPQTLNNFLRGHRPLPLEQLEKICEYLGLELNSKK